MNSYKSKFNIKETVQFKKHGNYLKGRVVEITLFRRLEHTSENPIGIGVHRGSKVTFFLERELSKISDTGEYDGRQRERGHRTKKTAMGK